MRRAVLNRIESGDQGTFGVLKLDSGLMLFTVELPWRNNLPEKSCIPEGEYECRWRASPKFGNCYHVLNVPDRSNILFHAGNFGGDVDLGFKSDLLGCIAPGLKICRMFGQMAVSKSRTALDRMHLDLKTAPFMLSVIK